MQEIKNKLMKRREVSIIIESASNPGFAKAAKDIAQHFKAPEEHVVVKRIDSSFGRNKFTIEANIYDSAKDKVELEPKKKEKKAKEGGK